MSQNHASRNLANQWPLLLVISMVAILVAMLAFHDDSLAQVTKGKERPLTTKQWMQAVHKIHCGDLKKGLDAGPSNDTDWDKLALHAAMLNESSYVLMADGRCPDGVWAAACKTLGQGSSEVLAAIADKDVDAANNAFGAMTASCGACHKAHKK
jgi:hypothetical protein